MLYKGQKVMIKKGNGDFSDEHEEYCYVQSMRNKEGQVFTIKGDYDHGQNCYNLVEDEHDCYWHENWLIPIGGALEELE